jgi:integrase
MAAQLTDAAIRNAKPRLKKFKLSAGGGLCLVVMPSGGRYWRFRYRYNGRHKEVTIGRPYPHTSLKQARVEAARHQGQLLQGIDPGEERLAVRLKQRERLAKTFGEAAEAWHAFRAQAWDQKTAQQVRDYLAKDLLPKLKHRPLDAITAPELGDLVARVEDRGAFDVAKKMRQWLKAIFSYSRAKGWTTGDPARDLGAIALKGPKKKNYPHLSVDELPEFLHALDAYKGSLLVKSCAWLALWTANRPGVTRTVRWSELDLDQGLWTIEPGREEMKRGYFHVKEVTGAFDYVFIGRNDPSKPISDGSVNRMIKELGYRGKQTGHGFRHLISTVLNDHGYEPDWVERQLAHGDPDKIRGTYNKAMYLEPRRKMMQAWADLLDELRGCERKSVRARRSGAMTGVGAGRSKQLRPFVNPSPADSASRIRAGHTVAPAVPGGGA